MKKVLCPVAFHAQKTPKKLAIQDTEPITYEELDRKILLLQKQLDYPKGACIATLEEKSVHFICTAFAAWRQGLVFCPINPRLPSTQMEHILQSQKAQLVEFSTHSRSVKSNIETQSFCLQLMTSGSSSLPKVAVFSFANLWTSAKLATTRMHFTKNHRWQASLPMFHIGGLSIPLRVFLSGATLSLLPFDEKATHLSLVPTQLYRLLEEKLFPSHLEKILLGGAPISPSLYEKAKLQNIPISLSYGSTEMSSQILVSEQPKLLHDRFYLGKASALQQMRLSREGEILVKGATLFQGYKEQGKLSLPLDKEGWFATKDLGDYHPKYGFSICGRKDHLIISGGENIHPEEVERALYRCKGVYLAFVVSIQDEEFGQKVIAFISTSKKLSLVKEEVKKWLANYKVPKEIFRLEEFSYTGIKPSRSSLTAWAEKLVTKQFNC